MSEETGSALFRSLEARLNDVSRERDAYKKEATTRRIKGKKSAESVESLTAQLAAVTAERDRFKASVDAAPGDQARQIKELQSTLRSRDHREKFLPHLKDMKPQVTVEKVWAEAGYQPEADDLDDVTIKSVVEKARAQASYLFGSQGESATDTPAPGGAQHQAEGVSLAALMGRGSLDTHGSARRLRVSETVQNPGYMKQHGKELAEGLAKGAIVLVDDQGRPA